MSEVADLFATLGLKVNQAEWARGDSAIGRARAAMDQLGQRFIGAGNALRGVPGPARAAGDAGEAAGHRIAGGFNAASAAIVGWLTYMSGHAVYDKLIASNQEYEDRTISLTAILQSGLGLSFAKATEAAAGLNEEFQRFDQSGAPAKMSEIAEFGKNVSASVFAAKGNVKDLVEITEQGVIASKVLAGNRGAGYAALELSEMLLGQVSNRMQFQKLLLAQIHMTEDQFRELDGQQRLATVKRALKAPALQDAKAAFAQSFSGVSTSLESQLEIFARQAGKPVFGALTEQLDKLNKWIAAHKDEIEAWVKKVGDGIKYAFNKVVEAIVFLSEHSTTLKAIMISLGAVMLATAVRAGIAWLAFLGPIGLIIAAVAGLAALVAVYWDDIAAAASAAWDAIVETAEGLWKSLKDGFQAAFEFIVQLPVIKQLMDLMRWADSHSGLDHNPEHDKMTQEQIDKLPGDQLDYVEMMGRMSRPDMFLPASAYGGSGGSGPVAVNVSMGDINVHSPNADPAAVADHVNATIAEHLGNVFRRTMDQVA